MSANDTEDAGGGAHNQHQPLEDLSSSHIGKRLKSIYDEIVSEPVPDKFTSLLESLERAEKGRSNG
ncbi:NepR family anti-sigma factor [Pararhizobium haloflavum]|uniref:NepR family anti-sigma factor n=1 Tax=Pararhizobium haloflavum TaxID=2037914 RepID=UPI000C19AAF9|nr:NepR family anti-sigma factor [Pararhizobium haloflavum]